MYPKVLRDLLITVRPSIMCGQHRLISILVRPLDNRKCWRRPAAVRARNVDVRYLFAQFRLHSRDKFLVAQINLVPQIVPKTRCANAISHKLRIVLYRTCSLTSELRQHGIHA